MNTSRTRRITISLAAGEHDALRELAHRHAEPTAAASRLIRTTLADQGAILDTPPARRATLAAWREQLDHEPPTDPRIELAFGHELRTLGAWLQDRARRTGR